MELYSPQIRVLAGQYIFTKGLELELNSCSDTSLDWAKLQFVSPMEQKITLPDRSRVEIQAGYNGVLETIFIGYAVSGFTTGTNGNEIIFKDGMLLLGDVTVNNTFVRATPQEIVGYCANLAGITRMSLDPAPYQPISCLPILNRNAVRVLRSLGGYWGISPKLYFQDDILFWGVSAPQTKLYHFEYAKNIISLRLADGYWELVTVSVPFVKHSRKIRVTHPKISGVFTVCRTRVTTSPQGFIRTTLFFKGA